MTDRTNALEETVAHQGRVIDDLSEELRRQGDVIDRLTMELRRVKDQVLNVEDAIEGPHEVTKPPHY